MRQAGFSLVELIVIIAVMGTLLAIGTLQFNRFSQKAKIESQLRTMYADLMKTRSEALLLKRNRSFTVTNTQFKIYTTADGSGTPIHVTDFKYPVNFDNSDIISFSNRGLASGSKTVCVEPAGNPAMIDSIRVTETMTQLGKWNGGNCESGNVTAK